MRICYVLLSPSFGMHQYIADLANRMAQAGHEAHLVTMRMRMVYWPRMTGATLGTLLSPSLAAQARA